MFKGEHLTPEFKAINPSATVPTLVDDDMKVFDSSAIAIYLVEKFAKDDSLYPKDLKIRTKVNEKLFYISSYLYPRAYQIFVPGYFGLETEIPQKKIDDILRGYETIEAFLSNGKYLAGAFMTIADLSLWPTMESMQQIIPIDREKFPNFVRWMGLMKELKTYEMNKKGADVHIERYRQCVEMAKEKLLKSSV